MLLCLGGVAKKAPFQQLEAAVGAWLDEQFQKNLKPHPNVLLNPVETIATDMGIETHKHLTTHVQWLDCFWFTRFKVRYKKLYGTTIYGNQRKLSAAEKRMAVSLLLAQAHEKTMADVAPTMFETFKFFGLIYNSHTRDFKFFTTPTFRYEMVDAVMEQFKKDMIAAAKPAARPRPKPKPKAAPKQMPITSFLR